MSKTYKILLDGQEIGSSLLENADAPMGVVFGEINFVNQNFGYDYFKNYCAANGIELACDYPEDKLISTSTIETLKVINDLGIANGIETNNAVSFSIDGKGYVGTGYSNKNDFWEYDPNTDTWTQKADFPGVGRITAAGFAIEGKGYIGMGYTSTGGSISLLKDFWEYDPTTDTWTQKADFEGSFRSGAVGFSINGKGYIGTGRGNLGVLYNDFWEYDPTTDIWTRKADFGGSIRGSAVGFSINNKGYIGTGYNNIGGSKKLLKDFWEYDPNTNTWIQKADFGGSPRTHAVGFSIGEVGYIGTGNATHLVGGETNDFWKYTPETNAWEQIINFEGKVRDRAVSFSIGNKGYVGLGYHYNGTAPIKYGDFWELSNLLSSMSSLESNNVKSIEVYPNPTSDYIWIKDTFQEVVLMHISGIVVNHYKEPIMNPISINHLENGVYLILGRDNSDKWKKGKFTIQKN